MFLTRYDVILSATLPAPPPKLGYFDMNGEGRLPGFYLDKDDLDFLRSIHPLKAIRSMGVPRKRTSFGSKSKPGRNGTMCSITLPYVIAKLSCIAFALISCVCSRFHRSNCKRASASAEVAAL
jgi:hypothetical protein